MNLYDLPDFAIHQIFLKASYDDIVSLQLTCSKFNDHIRVNRLYYSKLDVCHLIIEKSENNEYQIAVRAHRPAVILLQKKCVKKITGSLHDAISSLNPERLFSFDHDELVQMSNLWWKNRRKIHIKQITDFSRYLKHFDRCSSITLESDSTKNVTEILKFMESKNLETLRLIGNGKTECTDEDLKKIGRLSNNLDILDLWNLSECSKLSSNAILDMVEIGSFEDSANLYIPQIQGGTENFQKLALSRNWVEACYIGFPPSLISLNFKNGLGVCIVHDMDEDVFNG